VRPARHDEEGEGLVQLATFKLGGATYALDIMRIREIIQPQPITVVPRVPPFIEGVIELRGAIVPVVDLRRRFDLPAPPPVRATKVVVVTLEDHVVGLVVDGVGEVLRVPRSEVGAPPVPRGEAARTFSGVCRHAGRIILILDLDRILSSDEKLSLAGFPGAEAG
jgi:purine-binding chemotaxis protein CheW